MNWSEKKRVLVALCVSAVIVIALYVASGLCALAGKVYSAEVFFIFCSPFLLYTLNRIDEFWALIKEPKILSDYDKAHPRAVPPTRIAAIVCRQRRLSKN
ncbi:MAG: hypothetical protein HZC05_02050 [Candidatus Magasanikbacteria bacterium]|nr:hypothetical protein [Candidatus Magasanikbacteria bacterium]